jgi:hypothetical protein
VLAPPLEMIGFGYPFSTIDYLKGPKCEIFGFGFFALIRPIWIGDLGTRP